MPKNLRTLYILIVVLLAGWAVQARHIVGGEIRMEATAVPGRYSISLVQFWDENTLTTGNRDANVELIIYRKRDNQLVQKALLPFVSSQNVSYQNKACAVFRSLRTVEGIYQANISLSLTDFSDPQGYYIIWERCCRNNDLNNILLPGDSGMVFYLEFPPLSTPNSSPAFSLPNGEYICKDQTFSMNMSATDADGDELRYSLVTPMQGNTTRTSPFGNDSPKSSYPLVSWTPGISLTNIIPGKPSLTIQNRTGVLSVKASTLGLFVFTIQCEEYRNGKKIGVVRRDFQLLVIECSKNSPPEPIITYNKAKTDVIEFCSERPVTLETDASPNWSYQWQLNGQNIPSATSASISVRDTGSYSVVKSFKNQCSKDTSSHEVKLIQATPPVVRMIMEKDVLCEGDELIISANEAPTYVYSWRKDNIPLNESKSTLSVNQEGTYHLLLQDEKTGCTAKDSAVIRKETVTVSLPERKSAQRGNAIPLVPTVKSSRYPLNYVWSPPTGLNSVSDSLVKASPLQTTEYILRVTSPAGCVALDTILVKIFDKMYIPDAFSPNGDGINDTFQIANGEDMIDEISIYNRWGEAVFHSASYTTPWDGKFKEEIVPTGHYIYKIKTELQTYQGTLLILY